MKGFKSVAVGIYRVSENIKVTGPASKPLQDLVPEWNDPFAPGDRLELCFSESVIRYNGFYREQ
jgi:hypothetical protein